VASFADQVDDRPTTVAALEVARLQPDRLGAAQTAAEQERDAGRVTLPAEGLSVQTGQ
jgi:hypothetical protein